MISRNSTRASSEQGFVAMLTVMFFMILLSVITVSFTRFMIQERRQTLEDELTKSAYNSAMAGVEDAKRAMLYCQTLSGASKTACETELYKTDCPGFNVNPYFQTAIGVPRAVNGKTPLIGAATESTQGYSCVIVSKTTDTIQGSSTPTSSSGEMYEIKTVSSYDSLRISWQSTDDAFINTFYNPATLNGGNFRSPDWSSASPAALRLTLIRVPKAGFTLNGANNVTQKTTFLYPSSSVADLGFAIDAPPIRYNAKCDATNGSGFFCTAKINVANSVQYTYYVLVHTIYSATDFQIAAYDNTTLVQFNEVQQTIDSTGYASGVYRRVKIGVTQGGQPLNPASVIDSGLGFCKNFRVGAADDAYSSPDYVNCGP